MWAAQGLGKHAHVYLPLLSTVGTDGQTDRQVGVRCVRVCSEHTHSHATGLRRRLTTRCTLFFLPRRKKSFV